jgi:hypothetical protein
MPALKKRQNPVDSFIKFKILLYYFQCRLILIKKRNN